ncbi:MAG: alkaline phosphatase family protein [bacterium]|nr:alkaline phosphatase family protein [bacterium]
MRALVITAALVGLLVAVPESVSAQDSGRTHHTENVVLVTLDGMRWEEVFHGADNRMMNVEDGGVKDLLATRRRFWRGTPKARREVLMPFLWHVIAKEGQLFGDRSRQVTAAARNPHKFSYPGYSELLCGFVDERIRSNNKIPNPNVTVLEFLQRIPDYSGRIAAFSGWDVHPYMINEERSGVFVESAFDPITVAATPERQAMLQAQVDHLPRYWEHFAFDSLTFARAMEYLRVKRPRVLYLALGETDEWAHARRYDLYLQMANRNDRMIRELWEWIQADPQYRDKTSLLITVDHGRGRGPRDWTDHGANVIGAAKVWFAVMGPDTQALGVRENVATTLGMTAATVAALLGEDYRGTDERIAGPLPDVIRE